MISRTMAAIELKDQPLRKLRIEFAKRFAIDPAGLSKQVLWHRIAYHEEVIEYQESGKVVPAIVLERKRLVDMCTTDGDLVRVGILEPCMIGEHMNEENAGTEPTLAQKSHCPAYGKGHNLEAEDGLCKQCAEKFPEVSKGCETETKENVMAEETKKAEQAKKAEAARAEKERLANEKAAERAKAKAEKEEMKAEAKAKADADRAEKKAKADAAKAEKKAAADKAKADKKAKAETAKAAGGTQKAKKPKAAKPKGAPKVPRVKKPKAEVVHKPTKMQAVVKLLRSGKLYTEGDLSVEVAKAVNTKTLNSAGVTVALARDLLVSLGILTITPEGKLKLTV